MTLGDFKVHFMKCIRKYLIHHFHDILSSQARRNLYEKMTVVVGSAIPGLRAVPDLVPIHPILPPTVHIHL